MKIAFFDTHEFERSTFTKANNDNYSHDITFYEPRLTEQTVDLAHGFRTVCVFVNDQLNKTVLKKLSLGGTKLVALRCAGFNNVDLNAAQECGISVVRVPEYSPYAVAEHTVALILSLNRKVHRAYNRVRESNFSLDGLVGFDLYQKTVGIIGTGKIGSIFAKIMNGFGCNVIAYDLAPNQELVKLGVRYVSMEELLKQSDIISLHCPLTPKTKHLIDAAAIAATKPGVMLINTGRGALIDTPALIEALKTGHIGYAGLDVYEEEEGIFFEDHSNHILKDDVLARLQTFPNVILTSHQAFLTNEALKNIAQTTLNNISAFEFENKLTNQVYA